MVRDTDFAYDCWEVDHQSCGDALRPYCAVILRNKKESGKTVVKTSTDFISMRRYADELTKDLRTLSNLDFVEKYGLNNIS